MEIERVSRRARTALAAFVCAGSLLTARCGATVRYVDPADAPITNDGLLLSYAGSQILLQRETIYRPGIDEYRFSAGGIFGGAAVAIQAGDERWLTALSPGEAVGGGLPWSGLFGAFARTQCGSGQTTVCQTTGPWAGGQRYMALRFRDERGGAYYGWARVGRPGGAADGPYAALLLYDSALEDTPGLPILAGSRRSLLDDLKLALRAAGGLSDLTAEDATLLDHAGLPGQVDIADAARLISIWAGKG
ncbi:MAG TPA: hypothetical protein VGM37_12090 [Armatimonadota bacterium]|jgi:hypothetical protein